MIRGARIGSLDDLMYAIDHGIREDASLELIHITLIVMASSILVDGIRVGPLMKRFRRAV